MKRKKTNHFYILETALHWLDNHDEIANFHLILLLETTKYFGFTDTSDVDMPFFEMIEGILHLFMPSVLTRTWK
jgi:DNA repair protein RecO (recombination protein O)